MAGPAPCDEGPLQRSAEELVGRYAIACGPTRNLLVDYLKDASPPSTMEPCATRPTCWPSASAPTSKAIIPASTRFGCHPRARTRWKLSLRTRSPTTPGTGETLEASVERLSYLDTSASVWAFSLDLARWALEDPGRWGQWVAPSPIRQDQLARTKANRRRKRAGTPGPVIAS